MTGSGRGACVWLTGLSGAGKSTTADALVPLLRAQGRTVTLLDGDVVRTHLSAGLGFTRADRDANIRRIGYVASEIVHHGGLVVVAAVSPYREARNEARALIGAPHFVEVFVDAPLGVCEQRDVKGLYAKARKGELRGFTGIDDPYEAPNTPELVLDAVGQEPIENALRVLRHLIARGLVMPAGRAVIVNADDFGQSAGINRGVIESYERGIVTSSSMMVCWPAAREAAAYARTHPGLSVGLHADLREWSFAGGSWRLEYERADTANPADVEREVRRQLERFRDMVGRTPTHIDSHQHAHRREPVRSVLVSLADELQVPLREHARQVRYAGGFYGQTSTGHPVVDGVSVSRLVAMLRTLPDGVTEIGCHPGYADDLNTMYRAERALEVRALCSTGARRAIADERLLLLSFGGLA